MIKKRNSPSKSVNHAVTYWRGRRNERRILLAIGALLFAAAFTMNAADMTSAELWQSNVKNPNAHPNIPNCSFAGYHRREAPLPSPRVVANVKQSGAKGDGQTDDTAAFEAAIKNAAASKGDAVLIPAGNYLLNSMIRLNESGVVLRGEGEGKTILLFQKPLDEVVGARRSGSSSARSWYGGLIWMGPHVAECGVENLTIKMAAHPASKHLADKGFNGIYPNRALNCWVRNVTIEGPDNGLIHSGARNTTVTGLKITGSPNHHVTAQRVMSHGTFDSHRQMSWDLIRTNITINNDGGPGGGNQAGPLLGAHVVHWNICATGKDEFVCQPDCHSMGALVGIQGVARSVKNSWAMVPGDKGCLVADDGKVPVPPDLYEAQLKLRLGTR